MRRFKISVLLASIALITGEAGFSTSIVPPPDPVRLAAANALIKALPIEAAVSTYNNKGSIREQVTKAALEWLSRQRGFSQDQYIEQVFAAKVRLEVERELSSAIDEVLPEIADDYARRLSAQELFDAKGFALTPQGKNFVLMLLEGDDHVLKRVSGRIYLRIAEKLPQILESARESSAILKQVNR